MYADYIVTARRQPEPRPGSSIEFIEQGGTPLAMNSSSRGQLQHRFGLMYQLGASWLFPDSKERY